MGEEEEDERPALLLPVESSDPPPPTEDNELDTSFDPEPEHNVRMCVCGGGGGYSTVYSMV